MGGTNRAFPATCRTLVRDAGSADRVVRQRAWDALIAVYWKPVYGHLRLKWRADAEEAKDFAQAFFAHVLAHEQFARFDAQRAAFRTYLRVCLDSFVQRERQAAGRLKRGGGRMPQPLERAAEHAEACRAELSDPEAAFHQAWVRSVMELAVQALETTCRETGHGVRFQIFERYDLWDAAQGPRPTYAALAAEFGLTAAQVTNQLAAARREFRKLLLEQVRATTANETEFAEAARALLGEGS